jgi:hypothetical protein
MNRKRRTSQRASSRQRSLGSRANIQPPTPWWKRFGVGIITLILAPILVGVAINLASRGLPSQSGTYIPRMTPNSFDQGTNLCRQVHADVRCVLTDIGSNTYMTRKPMLRLDNVPTCASNLVGFQKWAQVNAIEVANNLVLNVASNGRAVVEIENLRISIVRRAPKLRTLQIECAGGKEGPTNYVYATVNLNGDLPKVAYYCEGNACPAPNVTIRPGGIAQFHISAYSSRALVEWRGRVDLIVNGRLVSIDLGKYISTPDIFSNVPECQSGSGEKWRCVKNISNGFSG